MLPMILMVPRNIYHSLVLIPRLPAKIQPMRLINTRNIIYSNSKNPFHTNLNGGALHAPPNTVGIVLSLGGVKNRKYSWLQDRPLGHVIWFTHRWDMANPKQ